MIIYDLSHRASLMDFGIEIPIMDEKVIKTIEYLKNHPVLGPHFDRLSKSRVTETITRDDLLTTHSEEYVRKLLSDGLEQEIMAAYELIDDFGNYNRYDPAKALFPLSRLMENELNKAAGTLECCKTALDTGFCFYLGGGSHHAQKDFGAGFCVLNDVVLSLRILQHKGKIKNAWVIDVDAHKGDGTSALTYSDPSIRTLSIHMAKGWPLDREESMFPLSFIPSDIEIPVEEGEDHLYNEKLKKGLTSLSLFGSPDIALVVSGTDPFEKDELKSSSGINLTLEQMMERDRLVYDFLKDRNIPSAYIMSGGYGRECWIVYAKFLEWVLGNSLSNYVAK